MPLDGRCNVDASQRADFLALAAAVGAPVHCLFLNLPIGLCIKVGHQLVRLAGVPHACACVCVCGGGGDGVPCACWGGGSMVCCCSSSLLGLSLPTGLCVKVGT
jgi:hypothetical protein